MPETPIAHHAANQAFWSWKNGRSYTKSIVA